MIESLSVRNVVLIDKLDLGFADGLTILSGETGAGKSILLDSLGLICGQRADVSLIRSGADKLSVTAVFAHSGLSERLLDLAQENDLEIDDQLVIKRSLSIDGKSKIFINDQPVSLKLLKEFGNELVEIHGQFDNQGLLNPANHLAILDNYGDYKDKIFATQNAFGEYKQKKQQRILAEQRLSKLRTEEDNLRHWVDELQKLAPEVGEEERLNRRRSEIINAEKLVESLNLAYATLLQNSDIPSAIRHAQTAIARADSITGGKYAEIVDLLEQALLNTDEAIRQIEEVSSALNYNQAEADSLEQRLFALRGAARKHQVEIDELPHKLQEMQSELAHIEDGEDDLTALLKEESQLLRNYLTAAHQLSEARHLTAQRLDRGVMKELAPLKMEKARFVTQFEELNGDLQNESGIDKVYFSVATNPNSPQGPLNKIASGGELARFMLALKVNLVQSSEGKTMIFDEVDSGVGGATAQAIGSRLSRLAQNVQVLIVTHSPQVAACGTHHFKVEKKTQSNITTTYITPLTPQQREEEIARMLAGETITDEARAAAKVLINTQG